MKRKPAMDALKTIAFLTLSSWGAGAVAFEAAGPIPPAAEQTSYVWRIAAGGDVLAAVPASDAPGAALILAPLEPALAADGLSVATGVNGALSLPINPAARASISAGRQWIVSAPARAAPWCGNLAGLMVYSSSAADCQVLAEIDAREPALARSHANLGYGTDRFDVSLGYGITRGRANSSYSGADAAPLGLDYLGLSGLSNLQGRDASGHDLALSGTWRFDPLTALRVTAAVGETLLREPLAPTWHGFEHAALGLGVSHGPFSGSVVGRVVRPAGNALDPAWSGVDIGVAWRTPWRGELSFGARNLLSSGPEPGASNPAEAEFDRDTARTPYVQYKQDL